MYSDDDKIINVFDNKGKYMSNTSISRAMKLVSRKCAYWISDDSICLSLGRDERRVIYKKIIKDSNNICYICNKYTDRPTIDHVIPKSFIGKGTDEVSNLKCCCKRCNKDKGSRDLSMYLEHIYKNRDMYSYIDDNHLEHLKY